MPAKHVVVVSEQKITNRKGGVDRLREREGGGLSVCVYVSVCEREEGQSKAHAYAHGHTHVSHVSHAPPPFP